MRVRDSDNQDAMRLKPVDNAERKATEQVSARSSIKGGPSLGEANDREFGRIDLFAERERGRGASLGIPTRRGFGLF